MRRAGAMLALCVGLGALPGCRNDVVISAEAQESAAVALDDRMRWDERPDRCEGSGTPLEVPTPEWEGRSNDRLFVPSNSGRLRLELPASRNEEGWIVFGDGDALADPQPGEACYPSCAFQRSLGAGLPIPIEGIKYPLRLSESRSPRLIRVEFDVHRPWDIWCQSQDPLRVGDTYVCSSPGQVRLEGDECVDRDGEPGGMGQCCQHILCNEVQVCRCDADGCRASDAKGYLELSAFAEAHGMIGVLDGGGWFWLMDEEGRRRIDEWGSTGGSSGGNGDTGGSSTGGEPSDGGPVQIL